MAKRRLDMESPWDIFGEGEDWRFWRQCYGKQDKVNMGFGRGYARQSGFQSVAGLEDEADLPSGHYTGFGLQGFHRTDDRIFDEVCMRLARHGQIDASEIQVEAHDAEVTFVYPASVPWPPRDAEVHGMASCGQGERGARGYFDHGESELRIEPGQFTGYRPRGYRRPGERIHEEVSERLSRHGQIDASEIELEVRNGEVTLRGMVDDRRTKRPVEIPPGFCKSVDEMVTLTIPADRLEKKLAEAVRNEPQASVIFFRRAGRTTNQGAAAFRFYSG